MCILHRDLGAHFVRGVTPDRYLANYMGRSGGVTGGKDGNMHFGDRELGCVGMVSMLPDMALVAAGMALAFKLRGEPRVAMTYFGEGSTANGQWHEAMNFAGVHRLPVVFVLENNGFAYSTPNELEFAVDPVERASHLRVPRRPASTATTSRPCSRRRARRAERARAGDGPDADRVPDDADARPRRPRRHELRARGDARGVVASATRSSATPSGWSASTASTTEEVESIRGEVKDVRRRVRAQGARLADARPRRRDQRRLRRRLAAARRRARPVVALVGCAERRGGRMSVDGRAAERAARRAPDGAS